MAGPAARASPDADVVIVGGGVMGLAIAYNLAARSRQRIVVIDGHYLAWGASGRNGGGVRQQWSTELNVRLMQESIEICADFAKQMRINVWMRQGGYLFLARTTAGDRAPGAQRGGAEPLRPADAHDRRPRTRRRSCPSWSSAAAGDRSSPACYNPTTAIVFPWPFVWGYARAAARHGVDASRTHTPVTAIERRGDDFVADDAGRDADRRAGRLRGRRLVARVARLARRRPSPTAPSPRDPARPSRSSRSSSRWSSLLETGLYFSQSLRGEMVGGISIEDAPGRRRPPRLPRSRS